MIGPYLGLQIPGQELHSKKDLKIEASKSYNSPRFLVPKIHERGKGQRIVLIYSIFEQQAQLTKNWHKIDNVWKANSSIFNVNNGSAMIALMSVTEIT